MNRIHDIETAVCDQKRFYSIFELDMDVINADLNDFIRNGRGCPIIVTGLGPI